MWETQRCEVKCCLLVTTCAAIVMSAGCSSGRTAIVDIAAYEHVVEVITDPPGARIVVNDDYVGDSPVTIRLLAYQTPSGNIRLTGRYVVEAIPAAAGQYTQCRVLTGSPPTRLFFAMNLEPVSDLKVDVDVKHR